MNIGDTCNCLKDYPEHAMINLQNKLQYELLFRIYTPIRLIVSEDMRIIYVIIDLILGLFFVLLVCFCIIICDIC